MYDSLSRKAGEPHMVENYIFIVFSFAELASSVVIEVNHVGFISNYLINLKIFLLESIIVNPILKRLYKLKPAVIPDYPFNIVFYIFVRCK